MKKQPLVSIIIPVYNESKYLLNCLKSLYFQSYQEVEIIIIDDGSRDNLNKNIFRNSKVRLYRIEHSGTGKARNTGYLKSKGEILVFIDADMIVDYYFIEKIISPIINSQSFAVNTKSEFVNNLYNKWSYCWSINNNQTFLRTVDKDKTIIVRAILKRKLSNRPFDNEQGYFDDKIEKLNSNIITWVDEAIIYHNNPDTLHEVFLSARWIGRSPKFNKVGNLIRYSLINSIKVSINKIIQGAPVYFIVFKIVFDFGIFIGIVFNNKKQNYAK